MSDCFFAPDPEAPLCSLTSETVGYLDVDKTANERKLYSTWFLEQIQHYGTVVEYIQSNYSLSSHDPLYGENTTKNFSDPVKLKMYVIYNSDSIVLNQLGIESDGDITAFIHIDSFFEVYGEDSEPLGGDIIRMYDYGRTNRPNGREAPMFELTHRDDEDLNQINQLLGHYVWLMRGKRYDYSYEENVTPESRMNQINDDVLQSFELSGTPSLSSVAENVDKTYEGSNDEYGDLIFNYDEHEKSNDSVYGDY